VRRIAILALEGVYDGAVGSALDVVGMANERALARLREHDPGARASGAAWEAHLLSAKGTAVRTASGALLGDVISLDQAARSYAAVFVPAFAASSESELERQLAALGAETKWLRTQQSRGAMLVSHYTSVFILAQCRLLQRGPATVPFTLERHFRRRFPAVALDLSRAIVGGDDAVLCGAALSSAYQLCWRLIDRFSSAAVAQRMFHELFFDSGGDGTVVVPSTRKHNDPLVDRAQAWLAHHLAAKVSMAELAEFTAVSERTLLRRFQHALRMTAHDYLRGLRLETAKRGLEMTRFQIDKIARGVGYGDTAFFTELFKRHTGMTPSAYRRWWRGRRRPMEPRRAPARGRKPGQ